MRALLLLPLLSACAARDVRPYALAEPVWLDPDESHVEQMPAEYWSGLFWDAVDQTLFVPLADYLAVRVPGAAVNVNAWDEVPDSSWFTNRIGVRDVSLEELAGGACGEAPPLEATGPWTVKDAKPNGANPGFIIQAQDGRRYLLKFDGLDQEERATASDVIGSKLYWAAGFYSPCNVVVHFDPSILVIDPGAESEDELGRPRPMTEADIDTVLSKAIQREDGLYRASASLFLPGRPIGPWTYQGVKEDDPNDVIPHEDRRELRGARLLAAWLNHFDAREQNTLAIWAEEDGRTFVRHYYLDFGDCFGSRWEDTDPMLSRRFGYSFYFDIGDVAADWLSFGTVPRPWYHQEYEPPLAPQWGTFDVEHFHPQRWKGGYPNPAFRFMLPEDGAWMARILARYTDAHLRAALATGEIRDPVHAEQLFRILAGRRDAILEHYLQVRSPLADFVVREGQDPAVCFTDLGMQVGVVDPSRAVYRSTMYFGRFDDPRWQRWEAPADPVDAAGTCVSLVEDGDRPAARAGDVPDDHLRRYAILDVEVIPAPGADPLPPARLHFYDLGDRGFRLVGIERPADARPPGRR